jgi:hypothetical protein
MSSVGRNNSDLKFEEGKSYYVDSRSFYTYNIILKKAIPVTGRGGL